MRVAPRNAKTAHALFAGRVPQSISDELVKIPDIRVSGGHQLLQDVGAIKTSLYDPSMGKVLSKNDAFTFFKTHEVNKFSPVVQDRETGSLRAVSNIVHIKDVTPEMREEILNSGAKEYYYQANLKFLSIQSSSAEILKTYSELSEQGHHVQLEAIKPGHESH